MKSDKTSRHTPVAIIGIGAMFPGAPNLKGYWRLLVHGRDAITEVPDSHWSAEAYFDPDPKSPDHVYCTRGGFLSAVPFDPTEYGLPPAILEATDTSQLLGLVTAKMALDDAGYGDGVAFDRERTSVILGVTGTQELVIPLGARLGYPKWRGTNVVGSSSRPFHLPPDIAASLSRLPRRAPGWAIPNGVRP